MSDCLSVVCCQLEISAAGLSLVQSNSTEFCVCVCLCVFMCVTECDQMQYYSTKTRTSSYKRSD
jgi:hypothetical protein